MRTDSHQVVSVSSQPLPHADGSIIDRHLGAEEPLFLDTVTWTTGTVTESVHHALVRLFGFKRGSV
ncbi:hypothetical protein CSO01_18030 [Cellulomonas soli]|uniref:Uncharacterized protein n=1 Tax=Cellulomonas soli TaxID=931535 RepID=A0A512PD25_9CELL|nr:Ser/Thr protein kinase RdoA (MazF antagonist) [Cellulomonas soli]GEP69088.1 hypothetical protein CSO01_18030 [Cellulomonas soli]